MSISPEFDKIKSSEVVAVSSSNGIECKLPLTEEEYKEILAIDATASLISTECYNSEIKYNGRAIFTVIYKSENSIKKQEAGVEFSFKCDFEKCLEGMASLSDIKCDNVKVNFVNGIAVASAVILFKGEITKPLEIEYFVKENQIMVKNQDLEYSLEVCKVKREFKLEDEFELPILVGDVLCHTEKVCVTACQSGIGVVIVDGEVELTSLICPLEQGKEPVTVVKKIPFRTEAECSDALPELLACAFVSVKNTSLKVYVDEAKNKSTVSVEVMLETSAKVYNYTLFSYCVDAYSPEYEIKLNKEDKKVDKIIGFKCVEEKISSEISFDAQKNSRLIGVISDKIEDVRYNLLDGEILIEGILNVSCLFVGETYFSKSALVPFSLKVKIDGNKFDFIKCEAVDVKVSKNHAEFMLKISFLDLLECKFKAITEVLEGQKKKVNNSAISVYIPNCGDELWDVAKELGVLEEDILKINKDLEFPLTGNERIVVYREK